MKYLLAQMGKSLLFLEPQYVKILPNFDLMLTCILTDRLLLTSDPAISPSDQTATPDSHSAAKSEDTFAKRLDSIFGSL